MITFALIMTIAGTDNGQDSTYVVDYNLTATDCQSILIADWQRSNQSPFVSFTCEPENRG